MNSGNGLREIRLSISADTIRSNVNGVIGALLQQFSMVSDERDIEKMHINYEALNNQTVVPVTIWIPEDKEVEVIKLNG